MLWQYYTKQAYVSGKLIQENTQLILSALSTAWGAISHSSGSFPSFLIAVITLIVLDLSRRSIAAVSVLSLPGTIAHELMHWTIGMLLIAKPAHFSVIPQRVGNQYFLGSVSFYGLNVFNGLFVALAPLLLLPIATLVFGMAALPAWDNNHFGLWFFYSVLVGNLIFSAKPSMQDLKIGLPSAVFYSGITGLIYSY